MKNIMHTTDYQAIFYYVPLLIFSYCISLQSMEQTTAMSFNPHNGQLVTGTSGGKIIYWEKEKELFVKKEEQQLLKCPISQLFFMPKKKDCKLVPIFFTQQKTHTAHDQFVLGIFNANNNLFFQQQIIDKPTDSIDWVMGENLSKIYLCNGCTIIRSGEYSKEGVNLYDPCDRPNNIQTPSGHYKITYFPLMENRKISLAYRKSPDRDNFLQLYMIENTNPIKSVIFSWDESLMALIMESTNHYLCISNKEKKEIIHKQYNAKILLIDTHEVRVIGYCLDAPEQEIVSISFNPDSTLLAILLSDGQIKSYTIRPCSVAMKLAEFEMFPKKGLFDSITHFLWLHKGKAIVIAGVLGALCYLLKQGSPKNIFNLF